MQKTWQMLSNVTLLARFNTFDRFVKKILEEEEPEDERFFLWLFKTIVFRESDLETSRIIF